MKKLIAISVLALALASCHNVEEFENNVYGNFDALWTALDEHYCFFEEKDIDWEEVGDRYRAKLSANMEAEELFDVCADMLAELRDGHTNLQSWFAVSYYRQWWSDYPQNFDWRLIQQYYLDFDYTSGNGMYYKILADGEVGYVYYPSFSYGVSDSFINNMMMKMRDCKGLIFDVRNNGGGDLTNVEALVSHFINERMLAGYIQHKNGPGHGDFSEPYPFYYEPVEGVRWLKPVIVLANRSTFSAANNFVSVMHGLGHVALVGDTTGGGGGAPFSSMLPCGWSVRFSGSPIYNAQKQSIEFGITPDRAIDMDPVAAQSGHDTILDFAIETLQNLGEKR